MSKTFIMEKQIIDDPNTIELDEFKAGIVNLMKEILSKIELDDNKA